MKTIGAYKQAANVWLAIRDDEDAYYDLIDNMSIETFKLELYKFLGNAEYAEFETYLLEEREGGASIDTTEDLRTSLWHYFGVDTMYAFIEHLVDMGYIEI